MEGWSRVRAAISIWVPLSPFANLMICSIVPKPEVWSFIEEKTHLERSFEVYLVGQACIKCHTGKAPSKTAPHGNSCCVHRMLYFSILFSIYSFLNVFIFLYLCFSIFNKKSPTIVWGWEKVWVHMTEESYINANKRMRSPDRMISFPVKVQVVILQLDTVTKMILVWLIKFF